MFLASQMLVDLMIYLLIFILVSLIVIMPKTGTSTDRDFIDFIESWAKVTFSVPPRMDLYIENVRFNAFSIIMPVLMIFFYSIDEGFIDFTSSLELLYPRIGLLLEKIS